jgi:hypothetical protein
MRERARRAGHAANGGSWSATWDHQVVASDGEQLADCFDSGLIAQHVASWHPAAALAMADLLDVFAMMPSASDPTDFAVALNAAQAYLGDADA